MSQATADIFVSFEAQFWRSPLGIELRPRLDAWAELGWIAGFTGAADAPGSIDLESRALGGAAIMARTAPSEEQLKDAVDDLDILSRLLALPSAQVRLSTDSFIGARHVRFVAAVAMGPSVLGPFVRLTMGLQLLPPDLSHLMHLVGAWNERTSSTQLEQLLFLADLRNCADRAALFPRGVLVEFDAHLAGFEIIRVQGLVPRWNATESAGPEGGRAQARVSLGVEVDAVHAFGTERVNFASLDSTGRIMAAGGAKRYLVFEADHAAFLISVRQEWTHRAPRAAAPAISDPSLLLPVGTSSDGIDFREYSARVLGFVPARAVRSIDIVSSGARWFADAQLPGPFLVLTLPPSAEGASPIVITMNSPGEAREFLDRVRVELRKERPSAIQVGDTLVVPTRALLERLATDLELHSRAAQGAPEVTPGSQEVKNGRLGVVIEEGKAGSPAQPRDDLLDLAAVERLLQPGIVLMDHQREGLGWMWRHFQEGRQGVLLADEMGLGKTLQVACFLALQRESPACGDKPALVVCPLLLLENWQEELAKFLLPEANGSVFTLHGEGLAQLKRSDGTLELQGLQRYAIVLTNYDTLDRYQQALLRVDWRSVVLDEAQNIKNPDTLRSRAARGLKRDFGICVTGTPVENRLTDLWTLFDFLSPGDPLTTRADFRARFSPGDCEAPSRLARTLAYPGGNSKVMRREKSRVLDLPPKSFVPHWTEMTAEQMEQERWIVSKRGDGSERSVFEKLNRLRALYQHPWLLRDRLFGNDDVESAPDLEAILQASPKLRSCLDILEDVRAAGEKALVFTPWTKMQTVLLQALRERFGLRRLRVVNGEANQRHLATTYIREFSDSNGFNVLVLSPLAAGAGLNIVAANHVIHYGRWWNPAKEDQATDRAHRIGQTRPVTVHLPVLHHRGDRGGGFDVKLHELVERKRKVARDFLSPDADVTADDFAAVLSEPSSSGAGA